MSEYQPSNPWPDDLVEKLNDADFAAANRMLAKAYDGGIGVGYGGLPKTYEEPPRLPEAERD